MGSVLFLWMFFSLNVAEPSIMRGSMTQIFRVLLGLGGQQLAVFAGSVTLVATFKK